MSLVPFAHQQVPRYLTQEQLRRFFAVIADLRDRVLFTLMYHHGLRVGEVLLLRSADVDLSRDRILIRRLKSGIWNEQVLFPDAAALLRTYASKLPSGDEPLFPGSSGPLKRRQIQALFARYRDRAELPRRLTTHSLRHSIATHLLDAGVSLEFVQDHLGHRSIRSTSIYARITSQHRAAVFRELETSPWIVQPAFPADTRTPESPKESSPCAVDSPSP